MSASIKAAKKAQKTANEPIFVLPPYKVEQVFTTYAETVDWGLTLFGIPQLWRLSKGNGVKVAVLDTGCALNHPDLKDAILKAKDFTRSPSGPTDVQGHGTHCCGVIAARENSTGVIGVAPEAGLLVGKVLGDNGSGSLTSVVAGIDWALKEGAHVISMSLGSPQGDAALKAACQRAADAGVFVIAAAGNEGPSLDTVGYPGLYETTIAVGAIDAKKKIASFSSRGKAVDIVAPGVDILSCYPPRNLAKLSGTSMATPFVAGVVALMLAKHRELGTETDLKTTADLLKHLKETAVDAGPAGLDTAYGWGLINPAQLLADHGTPAPTDFGPADFTAAGQAKLKKLFGDRDPVPTKFRVQVAP